MTDVDGSPETGWTGWQRVVVIVLSTIIGITAVLLVIFVFTNDEEPVPDPSTSTSTVAATGEAPSTSPPTSPSTSASTTSTTTAVSSTSTTGA